jgi:hypothetical protein
VNAKSLATTWYASSLILDTSLSMSSSLSVWQSSWRRSLLCLSGHWNSRSVWMCANWILLCSSRLSQSDNWGKRAGERHATENSCRETGEERKHEFCQEQTRVAGIGFRTASQVIQFGWRCMHKHENKLFGFGTFERKQLHHVITLMFLVYCRGPTGSYVYINKADPINQI